jgi:hypothetical protein
MTHPLDQLDQRDRYVDLFTDAAFFRPYVEEACRRHGLEPRGPVRVGVPGSCPVFIVTDRWLVKFYGRLFGGERSFPVERAVAELLVEHPAMPVPRLLGDGALDPTGAAWHWPYLIYEFIHGTSFGEVIDQIEPADRLRAARQVGGWVRALHDLSIPPGGPFPADFDFHLSFLEAQRPGCAERHRTWGTLPGRLLPEIEGYLLPTGALLLPGERPHIIHADLTVDHLLGRLGGGRWTSLAIIDFGDAITGGLFYELVALHPGLLNGDRASLRAFLDAYGYSGPTGSDFARRAMTSCLLHEFDVLNGLADHLDLLQAGSLEEIGERIWLI